MPGMLRRSEADAVRLAVTISGPSGSLSKTFNSPRDCARLGHIEVAAPGRSD